MFDKTKPKLKLTQPNDISSTPHTMLYYHYLVTSAFFMKTVECVKVRLASRQERLYVSYHIQVWM